MEAGEEDGEEHIIPSGEDEMLRNIDSGVAGKTKMIPSQQFKNVYKTERNQLSMG